ncbi:MAG: lipopolysaccharide assembly protein LapB [Pseudomonadales bacterium]
MFDAWVFLIILTAIFIGWLLGYYRCGANKSESQRISSQHYYKGMNYALNDEADGAIDAFLGALKVNSETIEVHLALGGLLRRRGEADRAIRIHQNLMSRSSLSKEQRQQVQYELAQDYMKSGWLDRAERLLLDLNRESPAERGDVLSSLITIYQQEREWEAALATVKEFALTKNGKGCAATLAAGAHFCCELAHGFLQKKDYRSARKALKEALKLDKNCVRASLQLGQLELDTGHPKLALKALKHIARQDMERVPDSVPQLTQVFAAIGAPQGIVDYLERCCAEEQSSALICCLYEQLKEYRGVEHAASYLRHAISKQPSLVSITRYIEVERETEGCLTHASLANVEDLLRQMEKHELGYQCTQCGFQGQQLHWLCPGCKSWGSVKMIAALLAH